MQSKDEAFKMFIRSLNFLMKPDECDDCEDDCCEDDESECCDEQCVSKDMYVEAYMLDAITEIEKYLEYLRYIIKLKHG